MSATTTNEQTADAFAFARIVWLTISMSLGLTVVALVKLNQIGPRVFWSSDACADPAVTCGVVPLVTLPAVLLALAIAVGGIAAINLLESRRMPDLEADNV